ncbi:MAG TPA: pyrophosphatase [Clostridiales bacterium]|nr:MAG: hypothetical protein A2Y22_01475 [Clostridiales bacterium GWD2_32_59]HAN10804.1 pyrophosphatase [Clostridiales bacterium]
MRKESLQEMLNAVEQFHQKHGFDVRTKSIKTMQYRMNLMMEELGEVCQCITKNKGDIAEEHADLLILLLGNCITMDIDLTEAFWSKFEKIMNRPIKKVGEHTRVSDWNGDERKLH